MGVKVTITIPVWVDKIFAWPALVYRLWKYGYTYRKISLGEGKFTIVDPQDFYGFNIFNWCFEEDGWNIYAVRIEGDSVGNKRYKIVSLHRAIMNHPQGLLIDHRNNNGLDNRRANLRKATKSQNVCNRRKQANTSSRFRGVSFDKRRGAWAVNITSQRKQKWIGYFDNEIDAAKAYDKAARKYHKEFAKLNFPEEIERSPRRLNSRSTAESRFAGRLANWLGASLNFPGL